MKGIVKNNSQHRFLPSYLNHVIVSTHITNKKLILSEKEKVSRESIYSQNNVHPSYTTSSYKPACSYSFPKNDRNQFSFQKKNKSGPQHQTFVLWVLLDAKISKTQILL